MNGFQVNTNTQRFKELKLNHKEIPFSVFAKVHADNMLNWTKTAIDLNVSKPTLLKKFAGKFKIKVIKKSEGN
jgi:hypothetical protein